MAAGAVVDVSTTPAQSLHFSHNFSPRQMKTGIPIQNGTGVTGITDGTEMVVTDGEDAILRHRLRLNDKRTGALHEKATKMSLLDLVPLEAKAP